MYPTEIAARIDARHGVARASTLRMAGASARDIRRDRLAVRARLDARQRRLVDAARSDSESGLESLLRIRLLRMGIVLRCQVRIRTVGRVDFVVGDRIILEVDGRENHDGESHRHRDLVRDANAAALGYRTLRFDYALVIHDWPRVERAIVGALRRRA